MKTKRAATIAAREFKGRKAFYELLGERFKSGVVLHRDDTVVPFVGRLFAASVAMLWT